MSKLNTMFNCNANTLFNFCVVAQKSPHSAGCCGVREMEAGYCPAKHSDQC